MSIVDHDIGGHGDGQEVADQDVAEKHGDVKEVLVLGLAVLSRSLNNIGFSNIEC